MRPIGQLLAELRQAKARVWADGDRLRYQAPKGALAPELLDELRARKAEVLEFCRAAQAETSAEALEPIPRDGDLPISLAQQRLWVLDRLEGPSAAYNIALALRFRGALDVDALRLSLTALMERHEPLRTAFRAEGETIRQVIAPAMPLPCTEVDLSPLPAEQRLPEARRLAGEEALRPFDLSRAPLVRFVLWRLDGEDHVLLINLHHIIADGRSIEVVAEELRACYGAYREGRRAQLPQLRVQYADFARHQRRWLKEDVLQGQLDYWKRQLAGLPPLLELPTERSRPPVYAAGGAYFRRPLESNLVDRLRQLARQSGASLNMVLLAGAAALLARHTSRDDIPIACPATHRNRPELEGLVGFFINTLVLRFDLSGNPSFRELLQRTRAMVADAFANQDVPFDKLMETLRPERNPSYPPLVQVSMAMLDGEKARLCLAGLETEPFECGNPIARYDLTLELYESAGSIDVYWIYNTSLFDAAAVQRMAGHLQNLLAAAVADPDRTVAWLPLLDEAEFRQVIHASNDTAVAEPAGRPLVHRVFEGWAERTPRAVALTLDGQALSYGELNARANRLAHRLIEAGVGPDQRVGVCLERSFDLVVAVLAVLKAGSAYVPLDPAYPGEWLAFMLRDSEARLLLTESPLLARLPDDRPATICLDSDREFLAGASADNSDSAVADENLVYVIYTSGSTGRPKGCQIEHRNLMHYLGWADGRYYPDGKGGSFGLFTPLAFDLTVTALFLALIRGRTLRIFAREASLDSILREYFAPDSMLDSIKLTPAHISLLPSLDLPATKVRVAVVGGEKLLAEQVKALWRLNPQIRIYNEYGPTEATVGCVVKEILPGENRILIGRPIDNMRAYVLDEHQQPLPVGVPGELYLGGKGLARGYLNRPELTAEKFIPDPYAVETGMRLYRSGDVARWLPSGNLECLGRSDHQVKIRGSRVELGEVEAVLGEHPAVRQAAVLVADDAMRGKHLLAYVAGHDLPTPAELRDYLRERLPDYMVPAVFVALDALPLTVNGKIDRDALPPPKAGGAEPAAAAALPRTEAERALAGIWSQLLGLEQIGVHDNFLDLGGHSLIAAQIIGRVREAFGAALPTRLLFEEGTVAKMAEALEEARRTARGEATAALRARIEQMDPEQVHELLRQKRAQQQTIRQARSKAADPR